jgi:hypothetical protein
MFTAISDSYAKIGGAVKIPQAPVSLPVYLISGEGETTREDADGGRNVAASSGHQVDERAYFGPVVLQLDGVARPMRLGLDRLLVRLKQVIVTRLSSQCNDTLPSVCCSH